ncbi:hypothetical protein M4I32_07755 [Microbacterium sp. LRZ72]|uniref:DUF6804 family protein n=1 Tax=Microbacterium sp. LRZ72 TaxID=2942481 RepID=UPI0029B4EE02|nr:DUF6804 family protein [Microbacterium sp. LRZ72]MDX2376693.1 hypothetical protein [Microbacterium sp. LRZ72]
MPAQPSAPQTTRPAFLPALIAAAALLSGIPLLGADWFLLIRFIVAIMALIVAWFAVQASQWWWTVVFFAVAIVWNPIFPVPVEGPWWIVAHVVVAALFAVAGALIRVPLTRT